MANFFSQYYLSIISGVLIGTSYIPFPPWAMFFCYLPLWVAWNKNPSLKNILIHGWVTNFVLTLIGFHWIAYTAHEFGQLPIPVSALVLILFCAVNNYFIMVAGLAWWLIRRFLRPPETVSLALLPLLTLSAETFCAGLFPWNFGYSWLYMKWPGFQVAEYIGFYGLSLIVFVVNWLLFLAWYRRHERYRLFFYFVLGLVLVTTTNITGYILGKQVHEGDRTLKILQVQANIGNLDKIMAFHGGRGQAVTLKKFQTLTEKGLSQDKDIDLIVWPETAFPTYLDEHYSLRPLPRRLRRLVTRWQTPLFTGAYSRPQGDTKSYNSVFLIDRDGKTKTKPYNKTILLAFGEYLPGEQYFPFVRKWVPTISDFGFGGGPQVTEFDGYRIGPQICYEALYPDFSNELARKGANLIVNVTNDSWFGKHAEPWQHLFMTLGRAVETRIPIIRNTNTGITTAITRSGRLLEMSPIHEEFHGLYEIPISSDNHLTFFVRHGYRLPYLVLALLLVLALFGGLLARRNQ